MCFEVYWKGYQGRENVLHCNRSSSSPNTRNNIQRNYKKYFQRPEICVASMRNAGPENSGDKYIAAAFDGTQQKCGRKAVMRPNCIIT